MTTTSRPETGSAAVDVDDDMGAQQIDSVNERRFVEIDTVLKRLNMVTAIVVAATSVVFYGRFGAEFLAFASSPMLWWLGRRVLRLQRRMGLRRWNAALIIVLFMSITGGAATSGGAASPVIYFAGLIGLFAQAMFPGFCLSRVGGLVVVALVALIDIANGQIIEPFGFVAAVVIAGYLPLIVRQLVEVEQIQRRSAVMDALTGCLNRRSFEHHAAELDAQARLTGASVAVISLDIDHFKHVNDNWGHAAGDQVLENFAYVARKELRRFELMFRLGGEEFAILLPDTDVVDTESIAQRIRRSVEATSSGGIRVTCSLGIAVGSEGVEAVLAQADERLYLAKRSGRNCVVGPHRSSTAEHPGATGEQSRATAI